MKKIIFTLIIILIYKSVKAEWSDMHIIDKYNMNTDGQRMCITLIEGEKNNYIYYIIYGEYGGYIGVYKDNKIINLKKIDLEISRWSYGRQRTFKINGKKYILYKK